MSLCHQDGRRHSTRWQETANSMTGDCHSADSLAIEVLRLLKCAGRFNSAFRLAYLCCHLFLCGCWVWQYYAKDGNLFQSAVFALWREIKCKICTLNHILCTLDIVRNLCFLPINMQLSVAETMLFTQQHTAEEAFQIDGRFCYPFLLNEIAREYYIQGACKSRQRSWR